LVPNTLTSLQTTKTAEAHLTEGQFLLGEQTFNTENSLMYPAGTLRATDFKREGQNLDPS
jgi:hypothetical protein